MRIAPLIIAAALAAFSVTPAPAAAVSVAPMTAIEVGTSSLSTGPLSIGLESELRRDRRGDRWDRRGRDRDRYDRRRSARYYRAPRTVYVQPTYYRSYRQRDVYYAPPRYRSYQPRRLYRNDYAWRGNDGRYYCRRSDGTAGLIIGAAVGGLIGRSLDDGRDRTLGTVIGAGAGALLGRSIDRGDLRCN